MADTSRLDSAYFISNTTYNCPFCERRNVAYALTDHFIFDWTDHEACLAFTVVCNSCNKLSMHLTFNMNVIGRYTVPPYAYYVAMGTGLDNEVFYSVPRSFFALDSRIPREIRDFVTEADGCLKMNFLVGASACLLKAIYELLAEQELRHGDYDQRIKSLKEKHRDIPAVYFDTLEHILDVTSDRLNQESSMKWDLKMLGLVAETLRAVLNEIYVLPHERARKAQEIQQLHHGVFGIGEHTPTS